MRTINEYLAKIETLEKLRDYIDAMQPHTVSTVVEYIDAMIAGTKAGLESVGAKPDDIIMPAGSGRAVTCDRCGAEIRPGDEPALMAICADCGRKE